MQYGCGIIRISPSFGVLNIGLRTPSPTLDRRFLITKKAFSQRPGCRPLSSIGVRVGNKTSVTSNYIRRFYNCEKDYAGQSWRRKLLRIALLAEFLQLLVIDKWNPNLLLMLEKTDTPRSVEQGRKCTVLPTP